jgi:diphthamide biosynthesis protein 7
MADHGQEIASQRSLTLDLPPSCLEFSPLSPSYFLIGTYNLQKTEGEEASSSSGPQKRDGSIVVYQLVNGDITHVHTERRPSAILDLRFQPYPGKEEIVGVVTSTGTLEIFKFEASSLTLLSTLRIPGLEEDVLFLSFGWHPTVPDTLAITTSQGGVHIMQLGSDYKTCRATHEPVITHSLETWCVVISHTEQSDGTFTLYTGGDDSVLNYATCSITGPDPEEDTSLAVDTAFGPMQVPGHNAGVTAILPLPCGKDIVVTGSYDDHIRVYSIQPLHETYGMRKTKLLAEENLGGGVWRLRLVKSEEGAGGWKALILASCMHAGSRIVEVKGSDNGEVELEVLARFEEHKSMNYASDFQPGSRDGELVCVSSSFYDKLLCTWSVKLP